MVIRVDTDEEDWQESAILSGLVSCFPYTLMPSVYCTYTIIKIPVVQSRYVIYHNQYTYSIIKIPIV